MSAAHEWLVPPPLVPGARVRVIAPSSPFDRTLALRGLAWLSERYRVEFDRGLFARQGFLAGCDERRSAELADALLDPGVSVVLAARGGYGLTRIAHRAPLAELRRAPRWLVGFSDFTALHAEVARHRVATLHAANLTGLGRADPWLRAEWIAALEAPERRVRFQGLERWRSGCAEGRLFGGNLTVLFSCAAAGRLHVPPDAVLFLEDVNETSYRLDRMLTALGLGGHFAQLAAVVLGDFTSCSAGNYEVPAASVLREHLEPLGLPLLAGVPVGHGDRNRPLPLGTWVRVDADAGELSWGR